MDCLNSLTNFINDKQNRHNDRIFSLTIDILSTITYNLKKGGVDSGSS